MKQAVVDKIEQSDFYQELIRKEQAELVGKRKAAAEALANIDAETAKKAKGLAQTIQEAQKVCAEAERAFQEAKERVNQLTVKRMSLSYTAQSEKDQHMAFLAETSDPRIDQAVQWFQDQFDALRRGETIQRTHRGGFDLAHMQRKVLTTSNQAARVRALTYCRKAIGTLQEMKLQAELDQEKLASLAEKMPDPSNDFDEVQGRKTERGWSDMPSWARFKTDAEHEADMSRLMQKADTLRKRA
jgi:hypothetical protein